MPLYDTVSLVLALIHAMFGGGFPVALQCSVALSPSVTGLVHCCDVTLGSTERNTANCKYVTKLNVALSVLH